ncbi:oxygen-independent coproporphyrinogen III oxidase [Thalassotalea ponticola]|uniref:oxygen-independent coproporphyrinogen III oxidase n=1 Tax=Thalassotalea ponticola TaxID=1523392 RepID=UPI0025B3F4DB|nr:oxygen-independent coproporphyrinogen III oxidase [Thalassotalea ponticola]MDN3652933.1 oxygen-independent coproporphyrinogen III oxidase [Thalassotalea ponticola]
MLAKYDVSGPRYTSYPTALEFNENFCDSELVDAIQTSDSQELSIYIHIPFCHSLCYYCGCNKIVTRHQDKADQYIDYLCREIDTRAKLVKGKQVKQMHWGGGTPTFLNKAQISRLVDKLKASFSFSEQIEMGIEVDPREISLDLIDHLFEVGFNRLSIGVQDVDVKVQAAINRLQSTDFIVELARRAKRIGFASVNIDLIYGLPHQTPQSFADTIAAVKRIDPDRISLFSYAHLPSRFAAQRKIKDQWLPNSTEKLALMQYAIESLVAIGYEFIGMDHFAKPEDDLAIAQRNGSLHRNFQGYTTLGDCDLLAFGVSAISAMGNSFSQNVKTLQAYYQAIEQCGHALEKGITTTADDAIRSFVIKQLMCNFSVDKQVVADRFGITFDSYFADELDSLQVFVNDGLVTVNEHSIQVAPKARLLIRNVCMSFDAYLKTKLHQQRFSKVI